MLYVNAKIGIPLRELSFSFVRSGGPGGQNVNKVNTKAVMRWAVANSPSLPAAVRDRFMRKYASRISKEGELVLTSQRFRDRGRNVADCLSKLRSMILSVATLPKPRRPTKPSKAARARRRKNKEAQSKKKQLRRTPKTID